MMEEVLKRLDILELALGLPPLKEGERVPAEEDADEAPSSSRPPASAGGVKKFPGVHYEATEGAYRGRKGSRNDPASAAPPLSPSPAPLPLLTPPFLTISTSTYAPSPPIPSQAWRSRTPPRPRRWPGSCPRGGCPRASGEREGAAAACTPYHNHPLAS
jgi:hypothetical protein